MGEDFGSQRAVVIFNGRLLVCGSRDFGVKVDDKGNRYHDEDSIEFRFLHMVLDSLLLSWEEQRWMNMPNPEFVIIEGDAWGADRIAGMWAKRHESDGDIVEHESYPADWKQHKRGAGPIRNQAMLDLGKPTLVLAFSNDFAASKGTANMIKQSQAAGVPVIKVEIPKVIPPIEANTLFGE